MQILATTLSVKRELGMKEKTDKKIMWYKTENLVYVNDEEIKRTIALCEKKLHVERISYWRVKEKQI